MKLKSMLISVSSAILISTLMAGCSGSKYSSVDNVQMSESKCDQISEYMHDYLSDQGLFVLDQSIEWCGYSKYQDLYSEEEYEQFEKAILQQLSSKIGQLDNATLKGTAGTTDQGYTLLTFAITESNGTVTTQYYIIGEKKYCLIQETNYDKSEECDDATMEAVNSFTW